MRRIFLLAMLVPSVAGCGWSSFFRCNCLRGWGGWRFGSFIFEPALERLREFYPLYARLLIELAQRTRGLDHAGGSQHNKGNEKYDDEMSNV